MTIAKNLTHTLFTAFIMITMTSSHQLNAMEQQSVKASEKISLDADFQAYLLLSTIDNNPQFYLPSELVQIITTNVSKFIDKKCYEKHGACLHNPEALVNFIEERCSKSMSHMSIANIVKRCLRYNRKSLSEITSTNGETVFHSILVHPIVFDENGPDIEDILSSVKLIKIVHLIVEDKAWAIICMKDIRGCTPLHYAEYSTDILKTLLSTTPDHQEAWNLILTPCKRGDTVLDRAKNNHYTKSIKLLKSYRPNKAVDRKKTNKAKFKRYFT
ncbi:MAG TPA: hypothetical protein VJ201_05580 [Candidatus Babeliales bacterium]|nr:hypothetical protein [Candidatus Babeliales bacterium]